MIWANVTKFGQNFIAPPNFFGMVRLWILLLMCPGIQWWILGEANEAVASGPPAKIAHTVLNPLQMFVQRTIPSEDLFFLENTLTLGQKIGKTESK